MSQAYSDGFAGSAINIMVTVVTQTAALLYPERPSLGDDPVIKGIRKAAKIHRPPKKKKPSQFFSIHAVFELLKECDADTCSKSDLRDKMSVLLLLDGMSRSSDLAVLDRESIEFSDGDTHVS